MGLLPALIGAGASLIGGAANRKAQRRANAANRPVKQVRQWEEAGINPLFGISSGAYIPYQATSIGDSFATAGGIFAQHLSETKEQELRETQIELENEKLKKELDELAKPSEPSHLDRYRGVLPLPSQGELTRGSNVAPVVGETPERLRLASDGDRDDQLSGRSPRDGAVRIGGGWWKTNPWYSDSEAYENRYGEPGEWVSGALNGVADGVATGLYWGQRGFEAYVDNVGDPFVQWMKSIGDDRVVERDQLPPRYRRKRKTN
jgi:hypothetical protein